MRRQVLTLQRRLTAHVKEELARLIGRDHDHFRTYQHEYETQFANYEKLLTLKDLIADLKHTDLILVGDFHTCYTSQKGFARILERLMEKSPKSLGIILECFTEEQKSDLRKFFSGALSESELMKSVNWEETWGFPFDHYSKILDFCNRNKIQVEPLRPKSLSKTHLKEQDHIFADQIRTVIERNPLVKQWIVLVGDWHLAPNHLPAEIQKDIPMIKMAVVHQNSEALYWKLAQLELENSVDVVRIEKGIYSINSVPPWIKYQSHVQWLRSKLEGDDSEGLEENESQAIVDEDLVLEQVQILRRFLQLPDHPDLDHFEVYSSGNLSFLEKIRANRSFSREEIKKIELWITERDAFFIPREKMMYFPFPKASHISMMASIFVHHLYNGFDDIFFSVERDFYRFLIQEAIGYLGAKIINPKLKCDLPEDFERMKNASDSQLILKKSLMPLGKERARMADFILTHLNSLSEFCREKATFHETFSMMSMHNERPYYWISSHLGRIFGESLYHGLMDETLSFNEIQSLWLTPLIHSDDALSLYLTFVVKLKDSYTSQRSRTKQARI